MPNHLQQQEKSETMAAPPKKAAGEYDAGATFHRIRITLTTSKSVANLEKVRV